MRLLTTLSQFFQDLRSQKLRTALTILGITWGTVAVVVLLAFGVGLEKQSKKKHAWHGRWNCCGLWRPHNHAF